MVKSKRAFMMMGLMLSAGAACGDGGGDDGEGSNGAQASRANYSAVADALARPTGTVDGTSAVAIAEGYEKINDGSVTKSRQKQAAVVDQACPGGGSMSSEVQSGQESAETIIRYNDCCYEGSCCVSGGGTWYYSTEADTEYSYCGDYDLTTTACDDAEASRITYEGCFGLNGWVYVVRVDGQTYAVTGYYSDGSGMLEVTGENGSFTCTYENGTGLCTGTSGDFSF